MWSEITFRASNENRSFSFMFLSGWEFSSMFRDLIIKTLSQVLMSILFTLHSFSRVRNQYYVVWVSVINIFLYSSPFPSVSHQNTPCPVCINHSDNTCSFYVSYCDIFIVVAALFINCCVMHTVQWSSFCSDKGCIIYYFLSFIWLNWIFYCYF